MKPTKSIHQFSLPANPKRGEWVLQKLFFQILGILSILFSLFLASMNWQMGIAPDDTIWIVFLGITFATTAAHVIYFRRTLFRTFIFDGPSLLRALGFLGLTAFNLSANPLLSFEFPSVIGMLVACIPIFIWASNLFGNQKNHTKGLLFWTGIWIPLATLMASMCIAAYFKLHLNTPNTLDTLEDWTIFLSMNIIAFPITIFAIQGYYRFILTHLKEVHKPILSKERNEQLSWTHPISSLERLEKLSQNRDVLTLDELLKFNANAPQRTDDEPADITLYTLRKSLQDQISERISRSKAIADHFEDHWCHHCRARMQIYPVQASQVAACRVCRKDNSLFPNAKNVIGVIHAGEQQPKLNGKYFLNVWDAKSGKFIPGDYDEIQVTAEPGVNPDWFINAMLEWRFAMPANFTKVVPVILKKELVISENSLRFLRDAEQRYYIQVMHEAN